MDSSQIEARLNVSSMVDQKKKMFYIVLGWIFFRPTQLLAPCGLPFLFPTWMLLESV